MYCKIQVAVCDIRGHMSDNEIKELKLLSDLSHDNIVKFVGVVVYDNPCDIPCSLVTELCAQGDLFDFVRRDDPVPPFGFVLQIFLDISKGLDYLHSRSPKIIHRDMKRCASSLTLRADSS